VRSKIFRVLLCLFVTSCFAQQATTTETSTGYFYPLGTTSFYTAPPDCGTWLGRDSANGGCYTAGDYHIGFDFLFNNGQDALNKPAFAISTGVVKLISTNGWSCSGDPNTNIALAIQHTRSDGTTFYAVYGHLQASLNVYQQGDVVSGGTQIGTIGVWCRGDHVHLGIFPVATMPQTNWGLMPDSAWGTSNQDNGAVDPLNWITTSSPQCQNGGTNRYTPGGNHAFHPNGTIITLQGGDGTAYVLQGGVKRGIPSRTMLNTLYGTGRGFDLRDIVTVSSAEFNSYPTGAVVNSPLPDNGRSQPDGRLIQQWGGTEVSIVTDNGFRRPFTSATAYLNLGYQFCNVAGVSDYSSYPIESAITQ